jgi:hypothetical protein
MEAFSKRSQEAAAAVSPVSSIFLEKHLFAENQN